MNWKSRLGKLEQLLKGTGNRAFQVATELRALWNDKAFLAEACEGRPDLAEEKLSRFIDAAGGYHLNELLQMLEQFPNQADWKDGHLRHLYDETCKALVKKGKSAASDTKPERRRVSLAEYEEVLREKKELAKRVRELETEAKRLREENLLLIKKLPAGGKAA